VPTAAHPPEDREHRSNLSPREITHPERPRSRAGRGAAKSRGAAAPAGLDGGLGAILEVLEAAKRGDFSARARIAATGKLGALARAVNEVLERNEAMAREFARVGRVVGREGRISDRASLRDLDGDWAIKVDAFNSVIGTFVRSMTDTARVITAVADGDLSKKMALEVDGEPLEGEFLRVGIMVNTVVDRLRAVSSEVTRVAKEVGTGGKLGGQAQVPGVAGTWKDLTDNVNLMASNLTSQVRGIVKVVTAVANGDLSQKFVAEAKGEIAALADTINNMTDTLRVFAEQVTTVAREVGIEGKLGGQAKVPGAAGTWRDLTENVNMLAGNLTSQVRNIGLVTTAVAKGDLSQKITVDARGEVLELKNTINGMVDQLRTFAAEATRVAKEVGTDGKLGGQALVPGVAGTWKDLTDNVNLLAGNLTSQVRNIALVTTAVANGDLSQKITVDAEGEVLKLKNTVNAMVDQLRTFAAEVTRVAREVGTDGKLGGQAQVPGVAGTWKDLTDNVNFMASNLTSQVRGIVKVVTAVATGDLSQKFVAEAKGEIAALADTINNMTDTLRVFAEQVTTVAREVGIDGKLGGQAKVPGAAGTWRDLTDNVNMLAGNLTSQVRNIALVTTAVAKGDLSQKITVDAKGEILELKNTINVMVDQLRAFAAEVTRVAREVGTDGKLGGQAEVSGVAGTWKDLTDNVNIMAKNLTSQVRGIVKVVTAVANGDLGQKFVVEAKGEIAALADTINAMTDTLRTFAAQVTTVAREVGIEGKLGGQAKVPGAAGTWRDLTDNVNQLAANLTTQVRAIAEVATAVTKGDLTRSITVRAQGEVLALKDNINQMIANLRDTTSANKEQDWLKSNLAKFSGMMQGLRSLESIARLIMSEVTPLVSAQFGAFYVTDSLEDVPDVSLKLLSTYAYGKRKNLSARFALGEGIVGQCALEKKTIVIADVPDDHVITTGLGESRPRNILVLPILFEGRIRGVVELGSFQSFSPIHLTFLEQLTASIGVVFNMIGASMRTEELLQQLQRSNAELETRTDELEEKASLLEVKNREIALASASLEDKAKQLGIISKYKSEFLANMSHELRTPLNSLLILAKLLSENQEGTLAPAQVEYARTIYSSGRDLLELISEILDLSKIEAGKMQIELRQAPLAEVRDYVLRSFRPVAEEKGLEFEVSVAPEVHEMLTTDLQRLQQVLKNLLSNAFKFTTAGRVELAITRAPATAELSERLRRAPGILAFHVMDTGIGIAKEKLDVIFEAFQQADASMSRTYGGTGLGLTISREIASVLGGEIRVRSTPGRGSTFTLYLPLATADLAGAGRTPPAEPRSRAAAPPAPRRADAPPAALQEGPEGRAGPEPMSLDGKKVLAVDDDARNLFAVTSLLERAGAEVFVAASAREALDTLEREPEMDVVLMDIMMPEVNGFEATRRIREIERFKDLPVIALTAKAMPGDREKCLEAGLDDFVAKPVESSRLLATICARVRGGAA
jgi:signal transduction histidine kinase/HAMP domain-containing protein/ActR/RegA family two-component response regulator